MTKKEIYAELTNFFNSHKDNWTTENVAKYEQIEQRYKDADKAEQLEKRHQELAKADFSFLKEEKKIDKTDEVRSAFATYIRSGDTQELRALNTFVASEGGVLVPTYLQQEIVSKVGHQCFVRRIPGVNIINTTSTLDIPVGGPLSFGYVGETGSFGSSQSTLSKATLKAYKIGGLIPVSAELLNDNGTNIDAYLSKEIANGFGALEEQEFLVGAGGSNNITGILRSSAPSQSLSTSSVNIANDLTDAFYKMPANNRSNAVWIVTSTLMAEMSKAKDGNGASLYNPATVTGQPTFLGRPIFESSKFTPTSISGVTVYGALIDGSYLTIGDRQGLSVARSTDFLFNQDMVAIKASKRTDIVLTNTDALVKLYR